MQTDSAHPAQKLCPVRVPWSISASTSFLKVHAAEGDSESPTTVTLVAEFGLESADASTPSAGNAVIIVQTPSEIDGAPSGSTVRAPTQLIRLIFENGLWVRFMHAHSDDQIIDEEKFDWSEVAHIYDALAPGIEAGRKYYWSLWKRNGICPDPHMYEVEGSNWLREIRPRGEGYKHYLMVGHDAYVEVIAMGWRWESIRALEGW